MAEGGDTFGYDIPILDHNDDDDEEQEINTTQPFQPGAASTPHPVGEQIQMQTMSHEQSGLPDTSYEEMPLLGDFMTPEYKQDKINWSLEYIKRRFPRVDFKKLGPIGISKKGTTEVVSFGPKGGETSIIKKDGSGLLKSFTDKFKKALGPGAEQIIAEKGAEIKDKNQEIAAIESHQQQLDAEIDKEIRQMKQNKSKSFHAQSRIEDVKEKHGDNASDSELRKWERQKSNFSQEAEKNEKKNKKS